MSPPTVHAEGSAPVITNSRRTPTLASERSSLISPLPPRLHSQGPRLEFESRGDGPELTRPDPTRDRERGSWPILIANETRAAAKETLYLWKEKAEGGLFFVFGERREGKRVLLSQGLKGEATSSEFVTQTHP